MDCKAAIEGGSSTGAETAKAAVCKMRRRVIGIDNGRQMISDVLFFGAHPDDVKWGAGGMALLLRQRNCSFGVVDLTDGEMRSRGNEAERKEEAREASQFVGAAVRESLHLPDCGLADSPEQSLISRKRFYTTCCIMCAAFDRGGYFGSVREKAGTAASASIAILEDGGRDLLFVDEEGMGVN
jgi:hypothetical protein